MRILLAAATVVIGTAVPAPAEEKRSERTGALFRKRKAPLMVTPAGPVCFVVRPVGRGSPGERGCVKGRCECERLFSGNRQLQKNH